MVMKLPSVAGSIDTGTAGEKAEYNADDRKSICKTRVLIFISSLENSIDDLSRCIGLETSADNIAKPGRTGLPGEIHLGFTELIATLER